MNDEQEVWTKRGMEIERMVTAQRDAVVESILLAAIRNTMKDRASLVAEIKRLYENADVEQCIIAVKQKLGDKFHGTYAAEIQRRADDRVNAIIRALAPS
jgi:hypothetical protein